MSQQVINGIIVNSTQYSDGRVHISWTWGGKRYRVTKANETKALRAAKLLIFRHQAGKSSEVVVDRHEWEHIEELKKKLDGVTLREAVEWYLSNNRKMEWKSEKTEELIQRFIDRKSDSSPLYVRDIRVNLALLSEGKGRPLHAWTSAELESLIVNRGTGPRARNNLRSALVTFFRWAKKQKALPPGQSTAPEELDKWKVPNTKIEIYTPDEMKKLLDASLSIPRLIPWIVLGGFSGIRSTEITGERTAHPPLRWEDILWKHDVVRVSAQKVRTKGDRLAFLPPNAKKWLLKCEDRKGAVWEVGDFRFWTSKLSKESGVKLIRNGMRHSYITYRMAILQDAAKVADECGNSPREIYASYRRPELRKTADAWFNLVPS